MAISMTMAVSKIVFLRITPAAPSKAASFLKSARCAPLQQVQPDVQLEKVDARVMCEPCNGTGWLLCDFCNGQKTNVKAENKRIYRRCPSCRAIGYVLCPNCKVFKCITFPDYSDGEELLF